jgi:hypothetical protein
MEDSRAMDQLAQQSTTIWTHGWSSRASLLIRLDNADLAQSTLTTDGYMWTISSQLQGKWLDLEVVNSRPHGSLTTTCRSCRLRCAICIVMF